MAYGFYSDPALTTPAKLPVFVQEAGGDPDDRVIYFGSRASSDLAVTGNFSVVSTGDGVAASAVRLSLTQAGLASATPGAAQAFTASPGVSGAVALHIRVSDSGTAVGAHDNLSIKASFTEVPA